jgi:hypothetical protein
MHRLLFLGLFVLTGIVGMSPAFAGRYCLQGQHWGYPGSCQFATYSRCQAAASGTNASCGVNPHYAHRHHREHGH